MQVSGINVFSFKPQRGTLRFDQHDYSRSKSFIQQNDRFSKSKPEISFTAGITQTSLIKTVKEFKELPRNRVIHCFYCQTPMFSPDFVEDLQARGVFSGPIKNFVNEIAPYKSYLKPTSFDIFKHIEKISKGAPNTHLSRTLTLLSNDALAKLRKKQIPIFDKLEKTAAEAPKKVRRQLLETISLHRMRMEGIPHLEEFNVKDFAYKIKNISKTVMDNRSRSLLSEYSELINHETFNNPNEPIRQTVFNKIFNSKSNLNYKLPVSNNSTRLYLVEQIKKIGKKLGREDILYICKNAEKMLLEKPVIVKFSNKAFMHDLNKRLSGIRDTKISKRLNSIAQKLPTSNSNINSFIIKHERADSNTIGYDLLKPSIDTLEHMHPRATRAPLVERLGNYALACGPCNNSRLDKDMEKHLMKYPSTSPQVYFNDIIGVVNDGFISLEDLLQMKETIYRESRRSMNISQISDRILRENFGTPDSQDKFDHFIELANQDLISGRDIYELQKMLRQRCGILVKVENLKYIFY